MTLHIPSLLLGFAWGWLIFTQIRKGKGKS